MHAWVVITIALSVCATAWAGSPNTANRREIKQRAFDGLKAAVTYEYNPGIRVAAVEAMEAAETEDALPWIRLALRDDYPAVRFAACLAVARLKDKTSLETVQSLIRDKDANVQVAALLACHALGDDAKTAKMPPYLLDHEDVAVRRNAAMVFGLFDSEGAVKILARAMSDKDNGVREYALEALARHRNPEGEQELVFMTNTGVGSDEVFAINALATTRDKKYRDTYLYK
ncbi:MAG: HEAT repeat domain-containing protein, partial [Planctomycetota bacterium]